MRKFLLIAATMFGFGCITPSIVFAAPVAGLTAIEAPFLVEQIKKDGYGYKADKHWKKHWNKSRHWDRRRGYSRYYDGPPPHASAYGRRAHDYGYYRYW